MTDPLKILVVDDEPDLQPLIRQRFRREVRRGELELTFASDGVEALERLDEDPEITVILTDINMPRMDGLTLLSRLKKLERMLESVVVTAYGDMTNIRTAMNRGAFDFLTKPIDLDDLAITIGKARELVGQQQRAAHVRTIFGRYLTDEVVSTLLEHPEAVSLGGEKRCITLLMSDIRGFSTISERLPPEQVVDILNIYLGRMADVITEYQGTIDEFIGDAIFVLFGAPILRDDDAQRAVACALAMQQAMGAVNADIEALGLPHLEMGIGINTGEVVVGNIGSNKRMKYGVVGSHVNLTSRIESYTVGGQILIAEGTLVAAPNVRIGKKMKVSTKGFSAPINIYEVQGIGAPFHLALPTATETMVPMKTPIAVRYTVLDGKHMNSQLVHAHFTALSSLGAVLQSPHPLAELDNLKIHLPAPFDPDFILGDLYAKVVEVDGAPQTFRLRFTAVPEDVAAMIAAYLY